MIVADVISEARASIRDQILSAVRDAGGSVNDYFVRFTAVDRVGFSDRQLFARSPDVDDPDFDIDYIGAGRGRRALWFYPLRTYLGQRDLYAGENPYVWLVRIRPHAWLQPVNGQTKQKQSAPEGQRRVGILRGGNPSAAIFFEPAFDVIGRYYDYAGQHQRHGQVKGPLSPTFFDRVRGQR